MLDFFGPKKDDKNKTFCRNKDNCHAKNISRLEKSIKTTSRWQLIWSGALTAVLASVILGIGQPLWEITVVNPLTLSKLKQDVAAHIDKDADTEKRLDMNEKLLTALTVQVQELILQMRKINP